LYGRKVGETLSRFVLHGKVRDAIRCRPEGPDEMYSSACPVVDNPKTSKSVGTVPPDSCAFGANNQDGICGIASDGAKGWNH
jgi:hypothetical protein